ncbi:MAG: penicillin-binding protein 2, partial [Syntrophobacterales bacterium]
MFGNRDCLTDYDPGESRNKILVFIWLVSCAFFLLIARLGYLQVFRGDELRQRSENNRIRVQEIKPLRGLIMDTRRNILVDNQPSFDISIIPEIAKDVETVKDKLTNLCDWEKGTLAFEKTSRPSGKRFVPVRVGRNIGRDKLAAVETHSLDLPGVIVDV